MTPNCVTSHSSFLLNLQDAHWDQTQIKEKCQRYGVCHVWCWKPINCSLYCVGYQVFFLNTLYKVREQQEQLLCYQNILSFTEHLLSKFTSTMCFLPYRCSTRTYSPTSMSWIPSQSEHNPCHPQPWHQPHLTRVCSVSLMTQHFITETCAASAETFSRGLRTMSQIISSTMMPCSSARILLMV